MIKAYKGIIERLINIHLFIFYYIITHRMLRKIDIIIILLFIIVIPFY